MSYVPKGLTLESLPIKDLNKTKTKFFKRINKSDSCWFWVGAIDTSPSNHYGLFSIKEGCRVRAHRFSYLIHKGNIPDGQVVRHTCDVQHCVNPDHLILGSQRENVLDAKERGRLLTGSSNSSKKKNNKLTKELVLEIRLRYSAEKKSHQKLADEYGVTRSVMSHVLRGDIWSWVGGPLHIPTKGKTKDG